MTEDKVISYPQSGMNRDVHPSGLKEQEYTFALNANIESEDGNVNMRSNEHSTLKCTEFGGYKVIGYKNDTQTGDIYFFLANPSSGYSKIAYLRPTDNVSNLSESEISDAVFGEIDICGGLQTLITDEGDEPCLHFSINHPIKTIEIKTEKCGKCIYWTDGYNPPRYVMVDKVFEPEAHGLRYYRYHGHRLCGETDENGNLIDNDTFMQKYGCVLACEKLRVFPLLEQPCIEVKEMAYGGSLRAGVYQFAVALCDEFGNEKTNYSPLTNPIHVFDEHDITVRDGLWGARTNLGVKLEVTNIDRQVSHFKIAVCQNTVGKNGETQPVAEYFIEGVHPITEKTIYYYSDLNNTRTTLEHIAYKRAIYNTSKGMVAVDNRLLQYGLTAEKEWNLQPMASILGHFLQWQSSVSTGELYKDGAACSLYAGYMRDEVYPFGIAFRTKTGYMTPIFTLVPPPYEFSRKPAEDEPYLSTPIESSKRYLSNCTETKREYAWQFVNTAENLGGIDKMIDEIKSGEVLSGPSNENTEGCKNKVEIPRNIIIEQLMKGKSSDGEHEYESYDDIEFFIDPEYDMRVDDIPRYISDNIEKIAQENSSSGNAGIVKLNSFINNYNNTKGDHDKQVSMDYIEKPEFGSACDNESTRREGHTLECPWSEMESVESEYMYLPLSEMRKSDVANIPVSAGERDDKRDMFFSNYKNDYEGLETMYNKYWFCSDINVMGRRVDGDDNDHLVETRRPDNMMDVISSGLKLFDSYPNRGGEKYADARENPTIEDDMYPSFQSKPISINSGSIPCSFWDDLNSEDECAYEDFNPGESTSKVVSAYMDRMAPVDVIENLINSNETTSMINKCLSSEHLFDTGFSECGALCSWNIKKDTRSYYNSEFNPSSIAQKRDGEIRSNIGLNASVKWYKFFNALSINATWIKLTKPKEWSDKNYKGEKAIYFEAFGRPNAKFTDIASSNKVRISFWKNSSYAPGSNYVHAPVYENFSYEDKGKNWYVVDISERILSKISESVFTSNLVDEIYVAIDSPMVVPTALLTIREDDTWECDGGGDKHDRSLGLVFHSILMGKSESPYVFGIRKHEIDKIKIKADKLYLKTTVSFISNCTSCGDRPIDCAARPYEYGTFGYFESSHKYPANFELWDSSKFKMNPDRRYDDAFMNKAKEDFMSGMTKWYGNGIDDGSGLVYFRGKDEWTNKDEENDVSEKSYTVKTSTVLCQTPIRHYKFPGNFASHFLNSDIRTDEEGSEIYPIGVFVNESMVNLCLDYAVDSGFITQEQRDSITGYEIYRGDRRLNKSVISCGLGFDMYGYRDSEEKLNLYPNYPYNDLGDDQYHYTSGGRTVPIKHPFNKSGNVWYSYVSPDMYFNKMETPSEVSVDGYMRGISTGIFNQVEDHPKWTILGKDAYKRAERFAKLESIAQLMSDLSNAFMMVVTGSSGGILGTGLGAGTALGALAAATAIPNILMKRATYYGKYRYDWLNSFINNGPRLNYAWYYTSVGNYNSMLVYPLKRSDFYNNALRTISISKEIKSGIYPIADPSSNEMIFINNIFREKSMFISFGMPDAGNSGDIIEGDADDDKYKFDGFKTIYPAEIKNYDTSRVNDMCLDLPEAEAGSAYEYSRHTSYIASPYFRTKVYKPNQYGDIEDIEWVSAGGNCNMKNGFKCIFGGDTYISKFSLKRKLPEFISTAFRVGDMIPFPYDDYRNIGFPKYFVNYDTGEDEIEYTDYETFRNHQSNNIGSTEWFPNRLSLYNLNGIENSGRYARGRFYLWFYGIPYFYVESDINCNFRLEGTQPHEKFYPAISDYMWWTQERNVPIERDNDYRISPIYNARNTIFQQTLPATYDGKFWDCAYQRPNGVIWSRTDVSENSQTDPWLTYRPMDYHEFPSRNGSLIHMKRIESNQILARFEDQVSLHNAIDVIAERAQKQTELGTGGLFASRPLEYNTTDLGYAGTQSTEMISCEFGHFWVDVKRAQVFMTDPNGRNLKELSTGIRHWLKNHLPFKILRYEIFNSSAGREMTYEDVDNKFTGLGLSLGWDNRFKRFFITKKDYIPTRDKSDYRFEGGNFYYENRLVHVTDTAYFKNVSFTLAYSCIKNEWISYYSFIPDYYIEQHNHFMSGVNYSWDWDEEGLWSHLLTNKHFQTFYGATYPFILEVPVKEKYVGNTLASVEYELDARDYVTDVDYTVDRKVGLDSMVIYNETNNSGELVLVPEEKNNSYQKISYPKISGNKSEILDTEVYRVHKLNDFFNRVKDDLNGILHWNKDDNDINKEINPSALDYGKSWMDRLRGSWFLMRVKKMITNKKIIFHWIMSETKQNNR